MLNILLTIILLPVALLAIGIMAVGGYITLSNGRWMYPLVIVVTIGLLIWWQTDKQDREWEQKKTTNAPLYDQCINNVRQNRLNLYNQAYSQNKATQIYINQLNYAEQNAERDCDFKYPH